MSHYFRNSFWMLLSLMVAVSRPVLSAGVNYEDPPISYSASRADNSVTRLQDRLDRGDVAFIHEPHFGSLRSLLEAFGIDESSQVLSFAKVSAQKPRIGPETPRAIYFNDEVHLGFVQQGVIEIAVIDPSLGVVFYTLSQRAGDPIVFERGNNSCLTCHGGLRTQGVPGLQVRSVVADRDGQPVLAAGSFLTTPRSPFEQRWGGWYVTGTHGRQQHLGNFVLRDAAKPRETDNAGGQNCLDLSGRFDTTRYLTPHSDLVALMVLEHQADTINALTRAGFEVRRARADRHAGNANSNPAAADEIIAAAADRVAAALLFADETPLTAPVAGTSRFVDEFRTRGPFDAAGRALREFDLQTRLFKYPVSYLIYSPAFRNLPDDLRAAVYDRLRTALSADSIHPAVERLTVDERDVLISILRATLSDWPEPAVPSAQGEAVR